MIEIDTSDFQIEKIDTTRPIPTVPRDMIRYIIELQEKMNEVIDVINILTLPVDQTIDEDEEFDENNEEDEEFDIPKTKGKKK